MCQNNMTWSHSQPSCLSKHLFKHSAPVSVTIVVFEQSCHCNNALNSTHFHSSSAYGLSHLSETIASDLLVSLFVCLFFSCLSIGG